MPAPPTPGTFLALQVELAAGKKKTCWDKKEKDEPWICLFRRKKREKHQPFAETCSALRPPTWRSTPNMCSGSVPFGCVSKSGGPKNDKGFLLASLQNQPKGFPFKQTRSLSFIGDLKRRGPVTSKFGGTTRPATPQPYGCLPFDTPVEGR